jgi:hypothetical protein
MAAPTKNLQNIEDRLIRRQQCRSIKTVIPNVGFVYPQGYEPGHLGVREKKKFNTGGKMPLLGYLFKVSTYKFEITATILITNILLI